MAQTRTVWRLLARDILLHQFRQIVELLARDRHHQLPILRRMTLPEDPRGEIRGCNMKDGLCHAHFIRQCLGSCFPYVHSLP
jgi:hypothetical protein